ncbi:MAG: hypothetical protein M3Q96_02400, partial [Pseudomonadota bacterium]|nr:hypothetical protein [Pseudomonadota bacterium]
MADVEGKSLKRPCRAASLKQKAASLKQKAASLKQKAASLKQKAARNAVVQRPGLQAASLLFRIPYPKYTASPIT